MYLGGADLAWTSDYAQIYLQDIAMRGLPGIEDVTPETMAKGYAQLGGAVVIYTADCLRQQVRLAIHDAPPEAAATERISEAAWTRQASAAAHFPSGAFMVSSPSRAGGEPWLPQFTVPQPRMVVWMSWLEYDDDRYNVFRPKPDVIQIDLWPA
jgi:hypothetical protein